MHKVITGSSEMCANNLKDGGIIFYTVTNKWSRKYSGENIL